MFLHIVQLIGEFIQYFRQHLLHTTDLELTPPPFLQYIPFLKLITPITLSRVVLEAPSAGIFACTILLDILHSHNGVLPSRQFWRSMKQGVLRLSLLLVTGIIQIPLIGWTILSHNFYLASLFTLYLFFPWIATLLLCGVYFAWIRRPVLNRIIPFIFRVVARLEPTYKKYKPNRKDHEKYGNPN